MPKPPDRTHADRPSTLKPDAPRSGNQLAPRVPGLATRRLAVDIISNVLENGRQLDFELDARAQTPAFRDLDPKDRGLMRAIVGMTLRRLGEIDDILDELMARPLPDKAARIRHILRVGAAQLLFLDVPDHAAVSISVELADMDRIARGWKGLVNGVLRTLARARNEILDGRDPAILNTPDWLWQRWVATYGEPTARSIAEAHLVEPYLDISVKSDPDYWAGALHGLLLPTGSIRIEGAGAVEKLAGFTDGAWWVQDTAASLPARLLGTVEGLEIADLCAAPGGKTAALASGGANVTAVDISPDRLKRMAGNLARLKLKGVTTVAADITTWEPGRQFDAVLLDAPCSATGTIRRHPDVALAKSPDLIAGLVLLQARLLDRVAGWVKPGGRLVYCTCSLEPEEGEAQADAFLSRHPDYQLFPVDAVEIGGIADAIRADGTIRTLPSMLPHDDARVGGMDGFFIARFVRN
jgi:16S rRNA (cytosine967-C5)-methyltransferase